jgi:NADPH:quinone reductase-like Zn-dependent oxidoreductase
MGSFNAGDKILIQNAGGGVGLAAIQIAKHLKADKIYGTASASKHALLLESGLDAAIDYRTKKGELELKTGVFEETYFSLNQRAWI